MDDENVYGDEDAILMDVPISFATHQELTVHDSEYKVVGDEDATLIEVPISFSTPEESKVDVIEKQNKIDEADDDVLMKVPISFIAHDESKVDVLENMDKQQQVNDDEDATLMEVPISVIGFEESKADFLENEMIPKNMHYLHTHTYEQRKKNWIIKNTSRRDGSTIDYVYHNLETNKKFRSLVEVYKFVVHGEVPETKKKLSEYEETLKVTPTRKQRVRGKRLIKHFVVGTCIESSNGLYIKNRGEVNYLREIPSNMETKRKRDNEDLYGHQQVNLGKDAACVNTGDAIQSFLYLWDFEPIQQRERPAEVFSIPDPLTDFLSSLPKAKGKCPYEEDEERNKSNKRKHVKEQEDILEAQRRSQVDNELKLDELRARAGGASSSVVPTQFNLISGVDVAMESQTLIITPPTTEGTPETTVDSFGATEATSLLPNSKA